ncbi:uncharacterized protein LOC122278481 [Carya illinoinensis]|uniref:uncharacterized protein LOC122278481 n=1 Tax=Carya illinoinensis TaxID=32201 RepID=UPI001C72653D|nr:uncharacterized protein LOC122278481 [Carya illinoinensis]
MTKLIAKVLANRLKHVLPNIISSLQSAFVPGRSIIDNVMVAYEILHTMKARQKGKEGSMALKLDMSKAYDRIEWTFLRSIMKKLGFCDRWIQLIMICVESVRYSVVVNGKVGDTFMPTRGLRQGDPLSPYLFILCAEGLRSMLSKAATNGRLKGVAAASGGTRINHLLFADDCVIFSKASKEEWLAIHDLLLLYEVSLGQKLNREKTAILFSSNTSELVQEEIISEAGEIVCGDYGKYLGLPTMIGRSKYETFRSIKERVWRKIRSWKNSFLSSASREVLIKAVLQSIPTYSMNVFRFTRKLCKVINSMIANFWWSGNKDSRGIHWKGWDKMGENKKNGGMGFRDIDVFNRAMLAKQGWMLQTNVESLAARIFKEKYFSKSQFIDAKIGYKPSFIWRSLLHAQDLVKAGMVWRVGNGKSISIWNNKWLPNGSDFKVRSPINTLPADSKVSSLIFEDLHCWNERLVGDMFSKEEAAQICSIPLSWHGEEDRILWGFTKDGRFSVRSAYHLGNDMGRSRLGNALKGILPTRQNLVQRKIIEDATCNICHGDVETVCHVLWSCPAASDVWAESGSGLQKWICEEKDFFQVWSDMQTRLQQSKLEEVAMILRGLWTRRNMMIFEGKFKKPSKVLNEALTSLRNYKSAHAELNQMKGPMHQTRKDTKWMPPDEGISKINFDAAIDKTNYRLGLGIAGTNHVGEVLFSFSCSKLFSGSSDMGEAAALWRAMELVMELDVRNVVFEGDANRVIKGVTDVRGNYARMEQMYANIRSREGNCVAHELAKRALRMEGEWCWIEEGPSETISLIASEMACISEENSFSIISYLIDAISSAYESQILFSGLIDAISSVYESQMLLSGLIDAISSVY